MTLEEIISNAEDNAHAMWESDPTTHEDYESEQDLIEAMVQNAVDDFVSP